MSLEGDLAAVYSNVRFADLPPEAVHAAKVSLVDALAVMLAATGMEPAAALFADHALEAGGVAQSVMLGRGQRVPAAMAALANGALAHAIDFEDTFDATGMHPNAAIIPAVLALAEAQGATGDRVLVALAAGCDLVCRLSLALDSDPAARHWYHPPMLGAAGAAVAASCVLGLSSPQIVDALSLSQTLFSLGDGLKRSPQSQLRAVRDGFAARAGVEAALLARRGMRGVAAPLTDPAGLFPVLTGKGPRREPLLDGLGRQFYGTHVTIKQWPSCRGTHPVIAAALNLRAEGVRPEQISKIRFSVSPPDDMLLQPTAQKQRPGTAIDAKFSIPFCFASALVEGDVSLESFTPEQLHNPDILNLAARVEMAGLVEKGAERFDIYIDGNTVSRALTLPPTRRAAEISEQEIQPKVAQCLAYAAVRIDAADLIAACFELNSAAPAPLFSLLAASP